MNFGNAGVEAVQAFGPLAIRQVLALDECVREESVEHVHIANESFLEDEISVLFGGYNVTHLTGIFSQVLPDLQTQLMDVFNKALKRADWVETRRHFGVRATYLLSADREGLEEYNTEQLRLSQARAPSKDAFVVMPLEHGRMLAEDIRQRKDDLQRRLRRSLADRHGTLYTLVAQLTQVQDAAGGNLAVHTTPSKTHHDRRYEDDDYYDDEEEGEAISTGRELTQLSETVEEQMLDKGSVFLINGAFRHGFEPVRHGKKLLFVMELWEYKDVAESMSRRATVEEGEALGPAGPFEGQEL